MLAKLSSLTAVCLLSLLTAHSRHCQQADSAMKCRLYVALSACCEGQQVDSGGQEGRCGQLRSAQGGGLPACSRHAGRRERP